MAPKLEYDPYEVLCLKLGATGKEIKKSYRKLALVLHPDKAEEKDKERAEANFHKLKEAYDFLSDKDQKEQYDREGRAKLLQQKERERKLAESSATRKRLIDELEKSEAIPETVKKPKGPKSYHEMSQKELNNFRQQNQDFLSRHNDELEKRQRSEAAAAAALHRQKHVAHHEDIDLDKLEDDILGDLL